MMYSFDGECCVVFFFKQKTAYEMRISDWSSDVCSSDLPSSQGTSRSARSCTISAGRPIRGALFCAWNSSNEVSTMDSNIATMRRHSRIGRPTRRAKRIAASTGSAAGAISTARSEEHTSELQSIMRTSYAVFCLQKKKQHCKDD